MKLPVCVKCRLVMTIKKTGADVEQMMDAERPYQIWNADIFACKGCGAEVVTGWAPKPLAEHHQKDRYEQFQAGVTLRFWDNLSDVPVEAASK